MNFAVHLPTMHFTTKKYIFTWLHLAITPRLNEPPYWALQSSTVFNHRCFFFSSFSTIRGLVSFGAGKILLQRSGASTARVFEIAIASGNRRGIPEAAGRSRTSQTHPRRRARAAGKASSRTRERGKGEKTSRRAGKKRRKRKEKIGKRKRSGNGQTRWKGEDATRSSLRRQAQCQSEM